MSLFQDLTARGLLAQNNSERIAEILDGPPITFYIGYDLTADSLTAGHFFSLTFMRRLQMAGHKPIALMGGGTTMIPDPTGKTDLRPILTVGQITAYGESIKAQISRIIDFGPGGAVMVNNADWLPTLNYVDFLRDVGIHFSVNRMLTAECYRSRYEGNGLSFIEFNYMLMQSYDFLKLFQDYGCILQCGGDDQWSNILAGADLIRRVLGKEAFALTTPLLETSDGTKMGKTAKGAVWLDPKRTSPYEFYQYWRNTADADVVNLLKRLTFLSLGEIKPYESLSGSGLNAAKEVLALEATRMVHGEEEAAKAQETARALFAEGGSDANMPSTAIPASELTGMGVLDVLVRCGLAASKGEARRLVQQGGVEIDGARVEDTAATVEGGCVIKKGKKVYHRVVQI
jgi:tyrosyl-tRNA synthetase